MVYKSDDRTPWMLFEVVNGFVTKLEKANAGRAIASKEYFRLRLPLR